MTTNLFNHCEADAAPTSPGRPFGGTSEGAARDPAAERILRDLAAYPRWDKCEAHLGAYRVLVGTEVSGRRIATVACSDGRSYDVYPFDTDTEVDIAFRLYLAVARAVDAAKMLPVERFLRGNICSPENVDLR